jgi:hypothetical protein
LVSLHPRVPARSPISLGRPVASRPVASRLPPTSASRRLAPSPRALSRHLPARRPPSRPPIPPASSSTGSSSSGSRPFLKKSRRAVGSIHHRVIIASSSRRAPRSHRVRGHPRPRRRPRRRRIDRSIEPSARARQSRPISRARPSRPVSDGSTRGVVRVFVSLNTEREVIVEVHICRYTCAS